MAIKLPKKMMRDLVLIKRPKEDVTPKNGIHLPPELKEIKEEEVRMAGGNGEVVMIGPDVETLEIGDIAVPKAFVGNAVEDTGDDKFWYIVIAEVDIMYTI